MTKLGDTCAFWLGDIFVDPARNAISSGEIERSIEPRIMDVIARLAAEPGTVIAREDLIRSVWDVEFGGDESLSRAISILRKTLKEVGGSDTIIETIPRRGYRLTVAPDHKAGPAPVTQTPEPETKATPIENTPLPDSSSRSSDHMGAWAFFGASLLFALFSFTVWSMRVGNASEPALPPERSIAVLPFVVVGGDNTQEPFADGLSEEVFTRISALEELKVAGRTASLAYKNQAADFTTIGKDLGVAYVLEGSVRRDGERVRISTQLVSTKDGYRLWSQSYDRGGNEIFVIQDDIARRVANALNARFTDDNSALKAAKGTTNALAHALYEEGNQLLNRRDGGVARAIERFEKAIDADPNYAQAYGSLASAHALSNLYSNVPKELARSRAASFARRALAINDALAEPYAVLGVIEADNNNWSKAHAFFEEAEDREPDNIMALQWHAETLMCLGYLSAANEKLQRAMTIDPASPALFMLSGHIANSLGDVDEADNYYRKVQSLGVEGVVFNRGLILFQRGEIEKAAELIATAYVHYQLIPLGDLAALSTAIQKLMRRESTVEAELIRFPTLINDDDTRTIFYLLAGQSEQALRTIETDADGDHDTFHHIWSDLDPNLRADPYFKNFVTKTGLRDYWNENGWPDRCTETGVADVVCM